MMVIAHFSPETFQLTHHIGYKHFKILNKWVYHMRAVCISMTKLY